MTCYQLKRCLFRSHANGGSEFFARCNIWGTTEHKRRIHVHPILSEHHRYQQLTRSVRYNISNKDRLGSLLNIKSNQTYQMLHSMTICSYQQLKTATMESRPLTAKVHVPHTLQEAIIDAMGSKYRVRYVDEGHKKDPVVLCLHGMPCSYKDFLPMMPTLVSNGARVILFNFPGMGYSCHLEGPPFDFSHLSKAKLIESFLSDLGISKVNMLVSHSASAHTGMQLCANTDLIQGVTFISPMAQWPHSVADQTFVINIVYNLLKLPRMRALIGKFIKQIYTGINKIPVHIPEVEYFYSLFAEARTWNWKQAEVDLKAINNKGMPVTVLATQNDPVVQFYILRGMMDILGISQENRIAYSADHRWQLTEGKTIHRLKYGVIFEKSSHWIQKSHPDVVAGMIVNFLKSSQENIPNAIYFN